MSTAARKRDAQEQYRDYRNLPVWDLISLEKEGVLNRKFRPKYIDVRVKRAVRFLWQEATQEAA